MITLMANKLKLLILILFLLGIGIISLFALRNEQTVVTTPQVVIPLPTPVKSTDTRILIQQPTIKRDPSVVSNALGEVTFAYSRKSFPNTANLYAINQYGLGSSFFSHIQTVLGVNTLSQQLTDATGNTVSIYKNGEREITYYQKNNSIIYTDEATGNSEQTIQSQNDAGRKASELLTQLFPSFSDISFSSPTISLMTDEQNHPQQATTFTEATLIQLNYERKLNGSVVYFQHGETIPLSITLDKQGRIRRLTFYYSQLESYQTTPIYSLDEAQEAVIKGQGVITVIGDDPLLEKTIKNTRFTSVSLGYLDTKETNTIQPVFIFTGTATLVTNTNESITVYLPAIKQ